MKKTIKKVTKPVKNSKITAKKVVTKTAKKVVVPTSKKTTTKKSVIVQPTKSTYMLVDKNIYFDGYSYRARVSVNGICNSKNFTNQRAAVRWRNTILKTR